MSQILYTEKLPELLKQLNPEPQGLYYIGNKDLVDTTCIAIVGTRKNTEYGATLTQEIVAGLANFDITIVSGLAAGIDTIAHQEALKNNLPTIAVLGHGLSQIYPKKNRPLAVEIAKKGLLLSQFPPETPPTKTNFPRRNQIIAGLSIATLVIEAPESSGALITARYALEQGRDIFVTPGDVDRPNSLGILRLLQRGAAYPIANAQDIIDALIKQLPLSDKFVQPPPPPKEREAPKQKLTPNERKILKTLSKHRGKDFDSIQLKCGLPSQDLLVRISQLEIRGLVISKHGLFYRTINI